MGAQQSARAVDVVIARASVVRDAFREATMVVDPLLLGPRRGGSARAKVIAAASSDAAVAERLLAPIVGREPALAPLLDALRAARAVQGTRRPGQFVASDVYGALQREVRAADAWRHVQGMDRESRIAALERMRAGTADQLDADDWKTLAGIIGDDVDGALTAELPRAAIGPASSLRNLALDLANEGGAYVDTRSIYFAGHTYFDAWKASSIDPAVRRARIDELLSGVPQARTSQEWRELTGLLHAGGHDLLEHPWFPGLRPEFGARHAMLGGYDVIRRFSVVVDTASTIQLETARRQLRSPGEIGDLARSIVQFDKLDDIGIVGAEAAAVRLRHMEPLTPAQARRWLVDVQSALRGVAVAGSTAKLRDSALGLVDKNLARIDGERWWRPRDGYSNHPDYAELGRVRSTWQLLEQLGSQRSAASAAGSADALAW